MRRLTLTLFATLLVSTPLHLSKSFANDMHPAISLLDGSGNRVLESGRPVSTMKTCGACHDTGFITEHDLHATATSDAAPRTRLVDPAPRQSRSAALERLGEVESNCFLCHLPNPANGARIEALSTGHGEWAATATLAETGLVRPQDQGGQWRYVVESFGPRGEAPSAAHGLRSPTAANCGQCHGQVHTDASPLVLERGLGSCCTETTGLIFSPQRLSSSGVNLRGREELYRPWDIHAERLLDCTSCHYSLNNPAYYAESDHTRPGHQPFEARKLGIAAYLKQPSHMLAKGRATQGTGSQHMDDTMRSCKGCHDPLVTHEWLPSREQHLRRLSCEACHIPQVFAPARRVTDWTVLLPDGKPRVEHRGVEGLVDDPASLVTGYQPTLLPREDADGETRIYPYNLLSTWFWVASTAKGERPATKEELQAAYYQGNEPHPAITAVFDADGDGNLQNAELLIDDERKEAAVKERLVAVGVENPTIRAELQPYGLHHGVATKEWVNRDCQSCHADDSRLALPFELAASTPGGVLPELVDGANVHLAGSIARNSEGRLVYEPRSKDSGLYVLGHDNSTVGDLLGLLVVLGSIFGIAVHGALRVRAARRRGLEAGA